MPGVHCGDMKFAHFSHVWNKPGMTAAEIKERAKVTIDAYDAAVRG